MTDARRRAERLAELHAAWMHGDNEDSWAAKIIELEEEIERMRAALEIIVKDGNFSSPVAAAALSPRPTIGRASKG